MSVLMKIMSALQRNRSRGGLGIALPWTVRRKVIGYVASRTAQSRLVEPDSSLVDAVEARVVAPLISVPAQEPPAPARKRVVPLPMAELASALAHKNVRGQDVRHLVAVYTTLTTFGDLCDEDGLSLDTLERATRQLQIVANATGVRSLDPVRLRLVRRMHAIEAVMQERMTRASKGEAQRPAAVGREAFPLLAPRPEANRAGLVEQMQALLHAGDKARRAGLSSKPSSSKGSGFPDTVIDGGV